MDAREFEKLYQSLFEIAWNSGENIFNQYHHAESEDKALVDASKLINNIYIHMEEAKASNALLHLKTDIIIRKSRKEYSCTNNEKHIIKKNDYYARIYENNSPANWTEIMCRICAAKILIIMLTSFNPVGGGGFFKYPSENVDKKEGNI